MASIVAGVVFLGLGLGLAIAFLATLFVEMDAQAFGANAGMGWAMLLTAAGSLASFALAVALFFNA